MVSENKIPEPFVGENLTNPENTAGGTIYLKGRRVPVAVFQRARISTKCITDLTKAVLLAGRQGDLFESLPRLLV